MSLSKATERSFETPAAVGWRSTLHTLMVLFKLRIVFLLLMAATAGLFLAAGGWPGCWPTACKSRLTNASASSASPANARMIDAPLPWGQGEGLCLCRKRPPLTPPQVRGIRCPPSAPPQERGIGTLRSSFCPPP